MAPKKQKHKKQHLTPQQQKRKSNRSLLVAIGLIAALIIVFGVVGASGLFGNKGNSSNPTATPSAKIPASADPYANAVNVLLHTSMGDITLALRNDMPITTGNFINLVNHGAYNGSTFHRVIKDFMIQGGQVADGSTVPAINDELTTTNHNYNGTIAMAKTSLPNSATSEFFINTADNSEITYQDGTKFDDTYSAFGKVISGMDVAMAISQVPTKSDAPLQTVSIIGASIVP
jgi:cyclophilin family peptidyl-prolyl cis-trans isomerase